MAHSLVGEHEREFESISKESNAVNMKVLPHSCITTLLQTDDAALGSISKLLIPKSATYDRDVNVRLPSDKRICNVTGICLTSNGDVYLPDSNSPRIKKLNESYTVTEHFDLQGYPCGLCEVDNNRLAVTLYSKKMVQILSQNPMSPRESFSVRDCCRGIDYRSGHLYVCCGEGRNEGLGRIKVYSMGGELLRVYCQRASFPLYVHVSVREDLPISNDGNASLVSLRVHDHTVTNLQIKALRGPSGMFRLSDNLLCVAGWKSHNIVLISEDGEHQQKLLTEKDGISMSMAVCFDRHRSRIIVSCYQSDSIKIFHVTT